MTQNVGKIQLTSEFAGEDVRPLSPSAEDMEDDNFDGKSFVGQTESEFGDEKVEEDVDGESSKADGTDGLSDLSGLSDLEFNFSDSDEEDGSEGKSKKVGRAALQSYQSFLIIFAAVIRRRNVVTI